MSLPESVTGEQGEDYVVSGRTQHRGILERGWSPDPGLEA